MSCQSFQELLSAEVDAELSAEEKSTLEQHLAECPACRSLRQRLAQMEAGFARLPVAAPPPLRPRVLPKSPPQSSAGVAALWSTVLAAAACAALMFWPRSQPGSDGVALYLCPHALQIQPPSEQALAAGEFRSGHLYGQALRDRHLAFEIQLDSHQRACKDLQLEVDYDFDNDGKIDRSEVYSSFHTDAQDGWEIYRSDQGGYSHQGEMRDFTGGTVAVRLRNATGDVQLLQGTSKLVLPYRLSS